MIIGHWPPNKRFLERDSKRDSKRDSRLDPKRSSKRDLPVLALSLFWFVLWFTSELAWENWIPVDYTIVTTCLRCLGVIGLFAIFLTTFRRLLGAKNKTNLYAFTPILIIAISLLISAFLPSKHETVFHQHREEFQKIATVGSGFSAGSPVNLLRSPATSSLFPIEDHFDRGFVYRYRKPDPDIVKIVFCSGKYCNVPLIFVSDDRYMSIPQFADHPQFRSQIAHECIWPGISQVELHWYICRNLFATSDKSWYFGPP